MISDQTETDLLLAETSDRNHPRMVVLPVLGHRNLPACPLDSVPSDWGSWVVHLDASAILQDPLAGHRHPLVAHYGPSVALLDPYGNLLDPYMVNLKGFPLDALEGLVAHHAKVLQNEAQMEAYAQTQDSLEVLKGLTQADCHNQS